MLMAINGRTYTDPAPLILELRYRIQSAQFTRCSWETHFKD